MFIGRKVHPYCSILFLVLVALAGFGCEATGSEDPPRESEPGPVEPIYPITIKDDLGRTVHIPARPERVISLGPALTDTLYSIHSDPGVVAVDDYSNWPEAVANLPRAGGAVNPDYDLVQSLEPDVVFVPAEAVEMIAELEERGMCVVAMGAQTFDDILANIEIAGQILGMPDQAADLSGYLHATVQEISGAMAGVEEDQRPTVFFEMWPDPLMTQGSDTIIDDLINAAGGRNAASEYTGSWVILTDDELLEMDPDVIITTFRDTLSDLSRGKRGGWDHLTAVMEDRVYLISSDVIVRPGPRVIEGLKHVARILYPDLIE